MKLRVFQHSLALPGGKFTRETLKLEAELCIAIKNEVKHEQHAQDALDNRWLTTIDFAAIHQFTRLFKPELERLITDEEAKEQCLVYQTLLQDLLKQGYGVELNTRLSCFAHLKIFGVGRPIFNKARPG